MADSENLQKLKDILAKMADLIREAEGTSDPILVADMRQRVAEIDIATFNIDSQGSSSALRGYTIVDGTEDPTIPKDTIDYYRKLLTNFANKVRKGSEKLDIDQIEEQENSVCGIYKTGSMYGIRIPDGICTHISSQAFRNHLSLTSISVPKSVRFLDNEVFQNCLNLTSVDLSNSSITGISYMAFQHCNHLYSITFPESLIGIAELAFEQCYTLQSLNIPASVTSIDKRAFLGCNLYRITVDSENPIYDSRDNCNAIIETSKNEILRGGMSTIIPSSVESIGEQAFSGCYQLTSMDIPSNVQSIGIYAFENCTSLERLSLPQNIEVIPGGLCSGCYSLSDISWSWYLRKIEANAFQNCTSLHSIGIDDTVRVIENYAFDGCSSATSLSIPGNIEEIGWHAFANCSELTNVRFRGTLDQCSQFKWKGIFDTYYGSTPVEYIECDDGTYEINGGGSSSNNNGDYSYE